MTTYTDRVAVKFAGEPDTVPAEKAVLKDNGWLTVYYGDHKGVYPPHLAPQLLVRQDAETEDSTEVPLRA